MSCDFVDIPLIVTDPGKSITVPADPAKLGLQIGFPEIAPLSREHILVSTWYGRCLLIDVDTGLTEVQPMVARPIAGTAAGSVLSTPCAVFSDRYTCAVATRSGWAGVWEVGDERARRIHSDTGPVNAVALSPDGDLLAIGTGDYPLGSPIPRCGLEIWDIDGNPRLVAKVRLPDVAIDYIWWDPDLELLLAWSGAATQDRAHLWIFDSTDLRLQEAVALDLWPVRCGALVSGGIDILTVGPQQLEHRSVEDPGEVLFSKTFTESYSIAIDSVLDEILLPSGELIDYFTGATEQLEPLPGCVAVAARPGGGFFGLSSSGVLRVWS